MTKPYLIANVASINEVKRSRPFFSLTMRHLKIVILLIGLFGVGGTPAFSLPTDQECTKLMVGAWASPRHEYLFMADGSWWMGKPDPSNTHGKWHISNGSLFISWLGKLSTIPEEKMPIEILNDDRIKCDGFDMHRIPESSLY